MSIALHMLKVHNSAAFHCTTMTPCFSSIFRSMVKVRDQFFPGSDPTL